jgi:hypothetical protein
VLHKRPQRIHRVGLGEYSEVHGPQPVLLVCYTCPLNDGDVCGADDSGSDESCTVPRDMDRFEHVQVHMTRYIASRPVHTPFSQSLPPLCTSSAPPHLGRVFRLSRCQTYSQRPVHIDSASYRDVHQHAFICNIDNRQSVRCGRVPESGGLQHVNLGW